jgi:hypothetical protein
MKGGLWSFNSTFNNISVISWRKTKYSRKTIDLSQVTDKLYHIVLHRVYLAMKVLSVYKKWTSTNLNLFYASKCWGQAFINTFQNDWLINNCLTSSEVYFSYIKEDALFSILRLKIRMIFYISADMLPLCNVSKICII